MLINLDSTENICPSSSSKVFSLRAGKYDKDVQSRRNYRKQHFCIVKYFLVAGLPDWTLRF